MSFSDGCSENLGLKLWKEGLTTFCFKRRTSILSYPVKRGLLSAKIVWIFMASTSQKRFWSNFKLIMSLMNNFSMVKYFNEYELVGEQVADEAWWPFQKGLENLFLIWARLCSGQIIVSFSNTCHSFWGWSQQPSERMHHQLQVQLIGLKSHLSEKMSLFCKKSSNTWSKIFMDPL